MRESTKVPLKRCFVDKIAILAEKSHDSFARIVDVKDFGIRVYSWLYDCCVLMVSQDNVLP